MKKSNKACLFIGVILSLAVLVACGSSSSSSDVNPDALTYAKFGETLNNAIPAGLKTGGANADISTLLMKTLSGRCASDYTDCPYITVSGGGDEDAGEILLRLWSLDYNDECTTAYLADGTCFDCVDCQTGSVGTTDFIKPTLLANPAVCASTSTTAARYVNYGVDPCFFDTMIGQISNIAECKTVAGGSVDISSAVPWYASWGLSQTVNFSSYYSRDEGGGIWWTVNNGASGNQQYFLSLDSNWLYTGFKDSTNDRFLFLGTGSPSYYAGRGEGSGVNIAGYAGTLSTIPAQFEAIQVRVQPPNNYIVRIKSNGTHLWYQQWYNIGAINNFPDTPAEAETVKNSPTDNKCLEIGTSVVYSKYAPLADCVTSFGMASADALNQDDNYTLKVIDGQTASSISFGTALTPTTQTSCLPVTPAGQ